MTEAGSSRASSTDDMAGLQQGDGRRLERVEVPRLGAFLLPLLWDVGLPAAAYYASRFLGAGGHVSLLAGTAVAAARVVWVATHSHRLDSIAAFLVVVFGVGVALSFATGDPRALLAKDSLSTATAGLLFLGTCVAGRPLAYAWGERLVARTPDQQRLWASRWSTQRGFRRVFYVISCAWGCGLLVEAAVRLPLVYTMPLDSAAGLSSILSAVTLVGLSVWTSCYARWVQR